MIKDEVLKEMSDLNRQLAEELEKMPVVIKDGESKLERFIDAVTLTWMADRRKAIDLTLNKIKQEIERRIYNWEEAPWEDKTKTQIITEFKNLLTFLDKDKEMKS